MIDHVALEVRDYRRSKDFYLAALAPLGLKLGREFEGRIGGFARDGKPWFWIREGEPAAAIHIAFTAPDTDAVDDFYAAAIGAGGEDNGEPGLRAHYHPATTAPTSAIRTATTSRWCITVEVGRPLRREAARLLSTEAPRGEQEFPVVLRRQFRSIPWAGYPSARDRPGLSPFRGICCQS